MLAGRQAVASQPVFGVDDPVRLDDNERTDRWVVETAGLFDLVGLPADGLPVVQVVGATGFEHSCFTEQLGATLLACPTSGAKMPIDTRGSAAMLRSFGEPEAVVNMTAKSRWK